MEYNIARYSGTLELDKILDMLANEATLAETEERARELLPVPELQQPEQEQERGHTWGGMEL